MDREEAIVRLEQLVDSVKNPKNQMALEMAIDDMREQDELERESNRIDFEAVKPEWIPVVDRLPEKDGRYLCVLKGGNCYIGRFKGSRFIVFGERDNYTVTHWIPLPKPPM